MLARSCGVVDRMVPHTVGSLHNVFQHRAACVSHLEDCCRGSWWGCCKKGSVQQTLSFDARAGRSRLGRFRFGCGAFPLHTSSPSSSTNTFLHVWTRSAPQVSECRRQLLERIQLLSSDDTGTEHFSLSNGQPGQAQWTCLRNWSRTASIVVQSHRYMLLDYLIFYELMLLSSYSQSFLTFQSPASQKSTTPLRPMPRESQALSCSRPCGGLVFVMLFLS